MTSSEAFWDRNAKRYSAKPVPNRSAYEAKLELIIQLLRRTDRVLELGCGTGTTALHLSQHCESIVATDLSKEMIAIARRRLMDSRQQNIFFEQASSDERLEPNRFDVAMAFSLLHLVGSIPDTLNAIHGQLRPGGLFISRTVCLDERSRFTRQAIRCLSKLPVVPPLKFLNHEKLQLYIKVAGFDVERICFFGNQRFDPVIVARKID
ncbi:MAG: class I SAM-dependent methyltransferase [Pseudomonadota bacterium]